ncbi:ATP-binding cassette domain-containing protein [Candidatus Bathyarchaeota archaeon]|nr:ATP-binding cassette domain-containing protein [Candidatus Bathyarchaeota archaeon]
MLASDDYILNVTQLNLKIQNQIILSNISFKLKRGTTLAIVGPNGAGKSMLFKTLLNLVRYEGKIDLEGKITMGYVPQLLSVKDIPISVREFLSIKKSSDLEHYLSLVGLSKEILDKSLNILSGGQLRRVLIAWAVLDKPNVLLFDEPTTGVDLDSEEAIYRMLRKLTKENGVTLLLISHDLHIVREYSDYVLALNKCVTFFGESKQIMNLALQETIFGEPVCMETP